MFSTNPQSFTRRRERPRENDEENQIIVYKSLELLFLASANFVNVFFCFSNSPSSSGWNRCSESIRISSERKQLAFDRHTVLTSQRIENVCTDARAREFRFFSRIISSPSRFTIWCVLFKCAEYRTTRASSFSN